MGNGFKWIDDPTVYQAEKLPGKPEIKDAYGQWTLMPQGREFEIWQGMTKDDPYDYSYVEDFDTVFDPGTINSRTEDGDSDVDGDTPVNSFGRFELDSQPLEDGPLVD